MRVFLNPTVKHILSLLFKSAIDSFIRQLSCVIGLQFSGKILSPLYIGVDFLVGFVLFFLVEGGGGGGGSFCKHAV